MLTFVKPLDLMIRPVARIVRELPPSLRRTVYPFLPRPQVKSYYRAEYGYGRDNKKTVTTALGRSLRWRRPMHE